MKIKKLIALVMATLLIAAMAMNAFAAGSGSSGETVTITVNRDSSYESGSSGSGRAFTWYKIFSVTIMSGSDTAFSGGHTSGVANVDNSGTKGFAYTATNDVAQAIFNHSGTTTANTWFELTKIAGSDKYVVTWKNGVATDADTLQEVAKWLIAIGAYESSGPMTFDSANNNWTADVEKGYYVISSDTGNNVIAATTDITVYEKNEYPPVKKEQTDEDKSGTSASGTVYVGENGEPLDVAIDDVIWYQVTVTIPNSAKPGDTIEVWDKPTEGLTYNNDLTISPSDNVTDGTKRTGEIWHKIITVVEDTSGTNRGTDVVFKYSMTINDQALFDTGRQNEVGLKYGNNYESVPHSVKYTTYFTGIKKIDGDTSGTLAGVKFVLNESGTTGLVPVPVTLVSGSYYIPVSSGSNEVITNASGTILIRGLDDDKVYILTETETLDGYNMLTEDITLTLVEDTSGAVASYNGWKTVINNKGTLLPSTGGIGTTIFYVVGAILVLGAVIVLVTRRRMSDNN